MKLKDLDYTYLKKKMSNARIGLELASILKASVDEKHIDDAEIKKLLDAGKTPKEVVSEINKKARGKP